MFESRCGICCDSCEGKTEVNCKGCLNMKTPFWGGDCEVKSCCEAKGLNHCGECKEFPCETISSMGKEQGYDPEPRLLKCRQWAEK
ncbi:DUF3795 domain-containing protein [Qiania dongpingensis]|uniref:DUF3795 domain-containing protein n=1 Tax=Qiania dongpingensis TaxID=2763669 RepID=A0A7G9G6D6_9FIRM|nr:DUF3795 domain-containing protein [Qiania dongpingensis]QNM06368.1 DUF3795 domain-containing protein [Qiania dongpingensis]